MSAVAYCHYCEKEYFKKKKNQKYCDVVCNSANQAAQQREKNQSKAPVVPHGTIDKGNWLQRKWEMPENAIID